jgi:hypothetical protein
MAVTTGINPADESASRSSPTTLVEQAAAETGSDMLQTISGMIYSGSCALAYGIAYAAVFVAQSLPQENPVMRGLRDGRGGSTNSARADGSAAQASLAGILCPSMLTRANLPQNGVAVNLPARRIWFRQSQGEGNGVYARDLVPGRCGLRVGSRVG